MDVRRQWKSVAIEAEDGLARSAHTLRKLSLSILMMSGALSCASMPITARARDLAQRNCTALDIAPWWSKLAFDSTPSECRRLLDASLGCAEHVRAHGEQLGSAADNEGLSLSEGFYYTVRSKHEGTNPAIEA